MVPVRVPNKLSIGDVLAGDSDGAPPSPRLRRGKLSTATATKEQTHHGKTGT